MNGCVYILPLLFINSEIFVAFMALPMLFILVGSDFKSLIAISNLIILEIKFLGFFMLF